MAQLSQQQIYTANIVAIYVKGKQVGRAQSIRSSRDFGTQDIYEIGSIMPQETVALKFSGTLSLSRFRIRKNDMIKAGLVSVGADILQKPVIDIVVKDATTGQVLEAYMGCTLTSADTEVNANEIISESSNWNFLWSESQGISGKERSQLSQVTQ